MKIPDNLYFTAEHLWVSHVADEWLAGITDYAQDLLGDIVFIQPPNIGNTLINGVACGVIESVKTGSDLHAPMNGVVIEINSDLLNAPEGINENPYKAWIFKFKPTDITEINHFLTAKSYADLIKST